MFAIAVALITEKALEKFRTAAMIVYTHTNVYICIYKSIYTHSYMHYLNLYVNVCMYQ